MPLLQSGFPFGALVKDGADEIEAGAGCQQRSNTGRVIRGRDLDKVGANDVEAPGDFAQKVLGLVIGEAAMADRCGTGRNRWIEAVDIDRDVDALAIGNVRKRCFRADGTKLA